MSAPMEPRIGSLCTGHGGLDAAVVEVVGGELAWVADNDPAAGLVLAHRHPRVRNLGDITRVVWKDQAPVRWVTAGYPCQPFSRAGLMKGVNDERHIWPYVHAAVCCLRPDFVFLENVAGHRSLGFGRVLGDLAESGYRAWWASVRASDVDGCHERERVFVLAASPDADCAGLQGRRGSGEGAGERHLAPGPVEAGPVGFPWGEYGPAIRRWEGAVGRPAPWPLGEDGNESPEFVEWQMGLPEGHVTAVPGLTRNQMIRLLGAGVVPQQGAHALRLLIAHMQREEVAA